MLSSVYSFVGIVLLTVIFGFLVNYLFAEYFAPPCPHCALNKAEIANVKLQESEKVQNMKEEDVIAELFN